MLGIARPERNGALLRRSATKPASWVLSPDQDATWGIMLVPIWKLSLDATLLALEAQRVIAMRLTTAALGRGTHAENMTMVTEKVTAFIEAAAVLGAGGSAHKVVRGYRKHVRANARRLRGAR